MKAPQFSLQNQDGSTVSLDQFKGQKVVLYFYPKADTPGCTMQACGMRDNIAALRNAGAVVLGVSPDEVKDLKKFQQKYTLPFSLLADPSTSTLQAYGVWQQKQFMGRNYMGVVRTTFLIDANGEIMKKYEKVNPETHASMILADLGVKKEPLKLAKPATVKSAVKKAIAKPVKKAIKKVLAKKAKVVTKKSVKKVAKKTVKVVPKKKAAKKKK